MKIYRIAVLSGFAVVLLSTVAVAQQPTSSRGDGKAAAGGPVGALQVEAMPGKLLGLGGGGIIRIDESAFQPGSGLITFSEFPLATTNPVYAPGDYGGDASSPNVSFAGFFEGQQLGAAAECPAGAALTGCVVGDPTAPLALDTASPATAITTDGSNPTSPVLSGSPTFNGPIAILFDTNQAGVGLDGGFFDDIESTAITAFARDGSVIGSVRNEETGIEFLGLVTADGTNSIAGLLFSLVGAENSGFAIDNLRFGRQGEVAPPGPGPGEPVASVPVPTLSAAGLVVLLLVLVGLALVTIRR